MTSIPVLDASQAAEWDRRARDESRIPSRVLMDAAGRAVALATARTYPDEMHAGVLIVAGHGNNGGDGWVAARALQATGVRTYAVEAARERSPDCEANRALALAEGVKHVQGDTWPEVGIVLDALLGTGAAGAPRGPIGELARRAASHTGPIVAVDGPTGLDLSTGEAFGPVRAALTVTFGGARRGHLLARDWCGTIVVADIGFPDPDPEWPTLVTDGDMRRLLPPFKADMHKGERGRVVVVGGQEGMAGAALHAASAAFAAGAGLVKIAAHHATVVAAQSAHPDALTVTTQLTGDLEPELDEAISWADAVVIGPGLGRGDERTALVKAVLERTDVPVVLDADALHCGTDVLVSGEAPRVLTPHPGEYVAAFPKLAGLLESDRFAAATAAAAELSIPSALLLKGVPTVVAATGQRDNGTTGRLRVVAAGTPALATGGSGDLLSGFIGAFFARGLSPADAAELGAMTLGRAAEIAAETATARATRPADVLAAVPELWRRLATVPRVEPPILVEIKPPALV